ncbi:helix-turn-helix domain-containing protein [Algoriphagus sp.]|uniref:helix-turn-helix domain-containing protein n=1 Tax=Algoriphagus sp. TaxID=1872435 RepID=UPI00391AAA8F
MNQDQVIGKNIQALRKKQGFAHDQIAEYLDITPKELSDFENGRRHIPTFLMSLLANLYGVDKYDFYEETLEIESVIPDLDFRVDTIEASDLKQLASFKKIIRNYLEMSALLEGHQH